MSSTPDASAAQALRTQIMNDPAVILDDTQILGALVAAEAEARGGNVVDMRSLAMARLEDRLDRLESTHQSVIEAAYDSVATTQQVHRALLTMIAPLDFDGFLETLDTHVADCLRLAAVRLVLESGEMHPDIALNPISGTLSLVPPEFIAGYLTNGRRSSAPPVVLRPVGNGGGSVTVYGTAAGTVRSEALMQLDLGPDRAPGLLVLGAAAPDHFAPGQATDLLELFGRVCTRLLRSWLG